MPDAGCRPAFCFAERAMTDLDRFFLRLRRAVLRCYEVGLYAMLLVMLAAVTFAAASAAAEADDEGAQCGNSQSSPAVRNR
jgi:hypothetical protein